MERTDAQARELAQLRYELARLRDRRSVRAALAVGGLGRQPTRRGGLRGVRDALRGQLPRIDMPGPVHAPSRTPYPHLRIAVIGSGRLVVGAAAWQPLTPQDAEPLLDRDRPDVLLIDDPSRWRPAELDRAVRAVRRHGGAVVTTPGAAAAAVAADLVFDPAGAVALGCWSPVGLDDTGEPVVRRDPAQVTPADARRQPIVIASDPSGAVAHRCLELLSAGALVVAVETPALARALAGLTPDDRDAVLVPAATDPAARAAAVAERVEALLADPDARRRLSVRLRRHVHAERSTDAAVIELVTALDRFPAPDTSITALLATRRPERLPQVLSDLDRQRHGDVEVVVLLHTDAPVRDRLLDRSRVSVVERVAADRPLGAVLDVGLEHARGRAIAKVDDDDRYGPDHLGDLWWSLRASGAEVVGRRVHGVFLEDGAVTLHPPAGGEERFEDHLPGATMLIRGEVLHALRWRHVRSGVDTELVRAVHLAGGSAYTAHRYGFVRGRHDDHTYDASSWSGRAVPGFDTTLLEA